MNSRLEKLTNRRTAPSSEQPSVLNEVYRNISQSESVRYVVGAMQPIDPTYTKNTYLEAERVINQLKKTLATTCEYEYQGSVTNDTHIKAKSDIDVLLIIGKFFTLEDPQKADRPYTGDPTQDLVDLRQEAIACISSAFPEANLDATGAKSISVEGGSLRRKIDVVPSNWYNTLNYAEKKEKMYRGVQILDAKNRIRIKNTPFLHNAWIEHKDSITHGGLRKAARLLKSLKYDTESIELSSYDLVSIAFNIPEEQLATPVGFDLQLLNNCYEYCLHLENNPQLMTSLQVPDGHRRIFIEGHGTAKGMYQLTKALADLVSDVLKENQRSFRRLADARVVY